MENKHTIYFNMCNHYKKIYNAKAYVDTSTPKTFRRKITQPTKPFNNINQINATRKDEHTEYTKNNLLFINQKQTISSLPSQLAKTSFFMRSKESISSSVQSNNKVTNDSNKSINNKSARKYAVSAHYHPSKRKPEIINISKFKNHTERHEYLTRHENIGEHRLSSTDVRGYLGDSSSDSAYNEGSAGESRGSSPKQMKSLSAVINKRKPILKEERRFHEKNNKTRETKDCSDEILYIRFLKDITDDILRKDVFTNKAMKCIFQHHIQQNIWHLNKNRMLVEIEKLQEQLGIPKDDKFNGIGFGLGDILNSNSCDTSSDRSNFNPTANNKPVTAPSLVTENKKKSGQHQTAIETSSSSLSKIRQSSATEKTQSATEIIDARTDRPNDNDKDVNNNFINSKLPTKQSTDQTNRTSNESSGSENNDIKSDHHATVSCEYYSDNFEDDSPPGASTDSIESNSSVNVAIGAAVAPHSAESSNRSNANDEIDEQFDDNEEDRTSENTVNEPINSDSNDNSIDEENSSANEMADIVDECEACDDDNKVNYSDA